MKAKKYLEQIELMDAKIDVRVEEVMRLKALATKTTAAMGGERVQASGSQQKMADCATRIVVLSAEINAEIDEFVKRKQEAVMLMDGYCDPECIRLIYARYFQYKAWESIAKDMGYTRKWVSGGLHQRALAQFQKGLDGKEKTE